jgi:FKBP-type peptidyl-prolyl cis-trans isomerase
MKHTLLVLCLFGSLLFLDSCLSSADPEADNAAADNEAAIQAYITAKNIKNVQKMASGLYYSYTTLNGAGRKPVIGEAITMHYKLFRVADGVLVDSTVRTKGSEAPITFAYTGQSFIDGIEEALRFLKKGERALFLMPNNLAFGGQSSTKIPAFAALGIDIEIVDVRNQTEQINDYLKAKKLTPTDSTSDGLKIIKTVTTSEAAVAKGQNTIVKYTGKLLTDKQFDTGQITVVVGSGATIKGFEDGIAKMKLGEKATLIFPSTIGYGAAGSGSTIPPYAPLVFDIEIVKP